MSNKILTPQQLSELAQRSRNLVEQGLTPEWGTLELPQVLGRIFLADRDDKVDPLDMHLQGQRLKDATEAFVGSFAQAWVTVLLKLHADLSSRGHLDEASAFEFGCDACVYALPVRTEKSPSLGDWFEKEFGPSESKQSATPLVLRTQSLNFLVVITEEYGRPSLHVRQFWDRLSDVQASGHYYSEQDLAHRQDLTLQDALRLAHTLVEKYSDDDVPGVHYVKRPSLPGILADSLFPRQAKTSPAFRYGDGRDAGYVVSVKEDRDGCHDAKDMLGDNFSALRYVGINLSSAICCLEEED